MPYAIAFGIGSVATVLLVRRLGRYYAVNTFIQVGSLAGTACVCFMGATTPDANTYGYFVLLGLGYGGAYVTRLRGLLSSTDKEKRASMQAASWTVNSTRNILGLVIGSAISNKLYCMLHR